jgi:glycosyltransferase involved in cell wall biosynthesis
MTSSPSRRLPAIDDTPSASRALERRQFERLPADFGVDVVIPVFNEERCLRDNVSTVHGFLERTANYRWRIVVADNASTDGTPEIAQALEDELDRVSHFRIPIKGRGFALRRCFLETEADIVGYMDVDLSTNLRFFPLLVEGIRAGYDLCVGSRLMQAARIQRSRHRELISRSYNLLIKLLFLNHFSDAQCGFKALRTNVGRHLLPLVRNNNWFFDTELLLLAERNDYRVFEVPVEWVEDPTSTVKLLKTIREDLLGLARMRLTIHRQRVSRVPGP